MRVFPALSLASAALLHASMLPLYGVAQTAAAPAPVTGSTARSAVPSSAAPATNAGAAMTKYHSDVLHLSYTYPSTYKDASATVGPAFEASISHADGAAADATRCITVPFSAINTASGFSIVLLLRSDASCAKKSYTAADLPVFTQGEVQGLNASGGHPQFGDPVSFTSGGHPAQMLHGSFTLPTGQAMRAMVTCVLLKPDIACFQFLGSSDDNLHTMAAFPVSYDDGPPAPLLPADVLSKANAK